jgi:signal transduction histidine kinase
VSASDPAVALVPDASMSARPARWPWVVYAVFVAVAALGTVGIAVNNESFASQVTYLVAFSMFGFVGATIVSRDRRNAVGAILLWASLIVAMSFTSGELFAWLYGRDAPNGVLVVLGILNTIGWIYGIMPSIFLLPLLFPDGRLPSPRWRPYLWFVLGFIGLITVLFLLGTVRLSGSNEDLTVANPFHMSGLGDVNRVIDPVIGVLYPLMFAVSVLSLVLRFRRAGGEQRQQIKWVVFGLVAALVGTIASLVLEGAGLALLSSLLGGTAFLAFPLTIGISVLRFRLYDLDVVVKKTLVAASIALIVLAIYAGIVSAAGVLTAEVSSTVVFAIALALGVAFRPVARLARRVADRLVYGRRATPYEVLAEFSDRVGGAYATDDVLGRMAEILGNGVGASSARVWLRVGGALRVASAWPADERGSASMPVSGDRLPEPPGERIVEVRDRGELIGALSVAMPASDPLDPAREKLVRDLASQAGLALRNVRLVEELKASQRRLVTAQDEERRRLERDIHDGAQQQLVALAVKARLARGMTERDPAKANDLLGQIEVETQVALDDLRDLARGIYPPLLADKGLAAAIEAQARRASFPVAVDSGELGRFPSDVEAAAYFSCLEALQNVGKYARANGATVRLANGHGRLRFEVEDDGVGFDPSVTGHGTGLRGIADRLGALDGSLQVTSAPGKGTIVAGEIPVAGVTDPATNGQGAG